MKQYITGMATMALIASVALNIVLLKKDGYTSQQREMMNALVESVEE